MAVTWQSQPNSAHSHQRRRRLASGPPSQVDPPRPLKLRPPATPFLRRRSTTGYRVASVDVLPEDSPHGRRNYALFSPYAPLPAIGDAKSGGGRALSPPPPQPPRPRLLRERTYSVLEPVLVRGPAPVATKQWVQPVRLNNEAWLHQPNTRPSSPKSFSGFPETEKKTHNEAWSSPRETSPTQLPNLVTPAENQMERACSPEMLDDVQLPAFPHEIDLDDDDLSTDETPVPHSMDRPTDLNATWTISRRRTSHDVEEPTEEERSSKVTDVTDSLKRLWTRL